MTQRERELECVIADLTAQARAAEQERDALRAELDALKLQKPVAWMKDQWSPDCGNYWEIHRDDEMGWRDREGWAPLYARPIPPAPSVPDRKMMTERMKWAIEGECDGLAIDDDRAAAILDYVMTAPEVK